MFWLFLIIVIFAIVGWLRSFYWYRKANDKSTDFWKITFADVIEFSMFVVVAWSAIIMLKQSNTMVEQSILIRQSNDQQRIFNINTLKPWISISLSKLSVPGDTLKISLKLKNHGLSPAMYLKFYCKAILDKDTYIADSLKSYALRGKGKNPLAVLFPNDSIEVPITRFIPVSEIPIGEYKTALIENRLFLHCYADFEDVSKNHIGYQLLCQVKLRRINADAYDPDLYPIYTKYEPLY